MSYVLFLDDERMPEQVTWAQFPRYDAIFIMRNYDAFIKQITLHGLPMFVCFDHDLADFHYEAQERENAGETNVDYGPEKTGYDCAKWLVDYCVNTGKKFPRYVVHSMNNIGKERIESYIENAKKHLNI